MDIDNDFLTLSCTLANTWNKMDPTLWASGSRSNSPEALATVKVVLATPSAAHRGLDAPRIACRSLVSRVTPAGRSVLPVLSLRIFGLSSFHMCLGMHGHFWFDWTSCGLPSSTSPPGCRSFHIAILRDMFLVWILNESRGDHFWSWTLTRDTLGFPGLGFWLSGWRNPAVPLYRNSHLDLPLTWTLALGPERLRSPVRL